MLTQPIVGLRGGLVCTSVFPLVLLDRLLEFVLVERRPRPSLGLEVRLRVGVVIALLKVNTDVHGGFRVASKPRKTGVTEIGSNALTPLSVKNADRRVL